MIGAIAINQAHDIIRFYNYLSWRHNEYPSMSGPGTDKQKFRYRGGLMKRNCYETEKGLAVHSDDYLLSVAIAGDHSAFIELSRRHTPMVLHVLTRITKNQDDVEEAMQETLMKAFSHLKTFEGRSSFSTWLTSIGINCALMVRRKEQKYREVPLDAHRRHTFPRVGRGREDFRRRFRFSPA